jgi:RNA polymerase sigma factor (sigma-70 family)
MATNRLGGVLGRLCEAGGTDHELLSRFVGRQDAAAFEALLARHGPMVLAVCRRTLADPTAAEDAFQATFLVFLRKAATVRRGELLSNWLYGVACRTAARARADAARRRGREGEAPSRPPLDPLGEITARELIAAVDEELLRLPARLRTPLVACYLDGKTRDEAAAALGWSVATLGRRLARGRDLLRSRLARRGVALSAAFLPAALAPAVVPSPLAVPVLTAAGFVTGGQAVPAGILPTIVETLSRRVVGAMFIGKLITTAGVLFAAGLVLLGVGSLAHGVFPTTAAVALKPDDPPKAGPLQPAKPKGPREHFSAVLDAVRTVENKTERVVLLIRVAQARAVAGDAAGAKENLGQALDLADGLDDTPRGIALREIAQSSLRLGDVTGALAVAEKFKTASHRNQLLFMLAGMQADAGDLAGARKTAATITDDQRDGAIEAVGRAEARAGDVTAALKTADALKHQPLSRAGVLDELALAQAKAGDRKAAAESLEESLRLNVATLADAGQRASARAGAAVRQAEIGDVVGALKAAAAFGPGDRSAILGQIAVVQAKKGDVSGAMRTLGDIPEAGTRARVMLDIATAQGVGLDRAGAEKSLLAAADIAGTLQWAAGAALHDNIRAVRAGVQVATGDIPGALTSAGAVTSDRARCMALLEIARAQLKAKNAKAALDTLGRAMKAADGYPEGEANQGGIITLVPAWALIKGSVASRVAAAAAEAGGEVEARVWAAGQKSPFVKIMALLGVAKGVAARDKAGMPPR